MILFYVDESGTGLGDSKTPYFVLGSIGISAEDLPEIDKAFTGLKRRLMSYLIPEDWEIKGRDLRRGEGVFKGLNWEKRAAAFLEIAEMIKGFPCQIHAVQVDKLSLPQGIETDPQLYRLGFWKLLEELNNHLKIRQQDGIVLLDMRSEMHSTIQDRRLIDAYRDWTNQRTAPSRFCELPLFGFSAFYAGLQLADFVSYLIDFNTNEAHRETRRAELQKAFETLSPRIRIVQIP